jgi:hypothetical protein
VHLNGNWRNDMMPICGNRLLAGAVALAVGAFVTPVHALTLKECSTKYKAAQSAGTLGAKTWNDFRKAECSGTAAPASAATTTAAPGSMTRTLRTGAAVFPTAVAAKYSSQTAGAARMHTCADQYRVNKAANGNGNLKWVQKGGGYYSECNKRLKGQ